MGSSLIGPPHQNDDDIDFPEDLFQNDDGNSGIPQVNGNQNGEYLPGDDRQHVKNPFSDEEQVEEQVAYGQP